MNHAVTGIASGDQLLIVGTNASGTAILSGTGALISSPNAIIDSLNGSVGSSTQLFNLNSNLITLSAASGC